MKFAIVLKRFLFLTVVANILIPSVYGMPPDISSTAIKDIKTGALAPRGVGEKYQLVVGNWRSEIGCEGSSCQQLGEFFKNTLKPNAAMNFDAGASSQLVVRASNGPTMLNTLTAERGITPNGRVHNYMVVEEKSPALTDDSPVIMAYEMGKNPEAYPYCTHVIKAFARVGPSFEGCLSTVNLPTNYVENVKTVNPSCNVLFSLNAANDDPSEFAAVCSDPFMRESLVESVRMFVYDKGYDGVDIDWESLKGQDEYPFKMFMISLRNALPDKLITFAAQGYNTDKYSLTTMAYLTDYCILMGYDYNLGPYVDHRDPMGPWKWTTGWADVKRHLEDFVLKGYPAHKLVLAMPFYCRADAPPGWSHPDFEIAWNGFSLAEKEEIYSLPMNTAYLEKWYQGFILDSWGYVTSAWVNDPECLSAKTKAALFENQVLGQNIGGVGAWQLDQDTDDGELITAMCAAAGLCVRDSIDVVEIIDRSGSMGGSKIATAKDAAKLFVDMMEEGDKIGVASFASSASVDFPLTEIQAPSGQPPQTLFFDNMESGTGNWSAQSPWGLTTSTYASPTHCWTDSPSGNYSNYTNTSLTLNQSIDLSGVSGAVLKFKTKYYIESGYDNGYIEVSSDGGAWTQIGQVTGTQSSWTEKTYPLTQFVGDSIRIRFRFYTDSSVTYDGWYIDDVEVVTGDFGNTKELAKSAIDGISATGMTSIGAGLQAAWGQLQNYRDDPVRAMVLMSDGQHNTSPHPDSIIPSIIESNVSIYTIGFGSGADAPMLTNIASQGNGKYYYAPSENELRSIYFFISGRIRDEQQGLNQTGRATSGQTGHSLTVDESVTTARIGIDWSGSDLDLALVNPAGETINHSNVDQYPNISLEVGNTYEIYVIHNPTPGHWEMLVDAVDVPAGGEEYRAYASFRTSITAELETDKDIYLQGEPMQLTVTLSDPAPITGADVEVVVTAPSEPSPFTVPLYDDGAHNDGAADDGEYGGTFTTTRYAESYRVQGEASGTSNDGYDFYRVDWKSVVVNPATDPDGDGMPSDWETAHGLDPIIWDADGDPDGDNVPNITEYNNGLDPQDADCDDDGWSDGEELGAGSDPLNPASVPTDDVTGQVDITFSHLRWDRFTLHSRCQVTIINQGSATLGPILQFAIGNIVPVNVTVANADGTTIYGEPYIDVGAVAGPAGLAPGESVTVTAEFHNADRERFSIEYSLLTERPLPAHEAATMQTMALEQEAATSARRDKAEERRLEAVIEGVDLGPTFEGSQPPKIHGDISGNRAVKCEDMMFLADEWLRTGCSEWNTWCEGADVNNDGKVDLRDMAVLANSWLETEHW